MNWLGRIVGAELTYLRAAREELMRRVANLQAELGAALELLRDARLELQAEKERVCRVDNECMDLRRALETLQARLAMAEDAAQKGEEGRAQGTALEECSKEHAELRQRVHILREALDGCRGQWIHSVNAESCLKALAQTGEPI